LVVHLFNCISYLLLLFLELKTLGFLFYFHFLNFVLEDFGLSVNTLFLFLDVFLKLEIKVSCL